MTQSNNPKSTVDIALPDLEQARMRAAYAGLALGNRGYVQGASPVSQTTPTALTDIMAVVLTRKASGIFVVSGTVGWTGGNTDTYTTALRSYVQVATVLPLGNATSAGAGTNGFNATASGPITYAGAPTPTTILTTGAIETITNELVQQEGFSTIVAPAALALAENVVFSLAVQASAGNFVAIAGSAALFAYELP
jgi:hypothetical protein